MALVTPRYGWYNFIISDVHVIQKEKTRSKGAALSLVGKIGANRSLSYRCCSGGEFEQQRVTEEVPAGNGRVRDRSHKREQWD
jgi:hypothetical protein